MSFQPATIVPILVLNMLKNKGYVEWGPLTNFDKKLITFYITGVLAIWLSVVYFLFFKPLYEEYKDPYPTKEQWNAVFENKCTFNHIRENVTRKSIVLKRAHISKASKDCGDVLKGVLNE